MKLTLERVKKESGNVRSFIFKPEKPLKWKAGQFLHYILHHEPTDERGSDRWFTIAAPPFEGKSRISTRIAGEKGSSFKKALVELKIGDSIEAEGPDGDFILEDPSKDYIFIAGGIGITPYRSIVLDLDHSKKPLNIRLLYSNKDENIVYKDELDALAKKHPELKIDYIIGERIDVNKIRELVGNYKEKIVYISGPEPMVESLGNSLKEDGLAEDHLKQDWFPGYPED